MSTQIKDPKANMPTSGRGSGTLSGAAQGAAAGSMIMPGVGTVVGAIFGAAVGFFGGSEQDKAAKHATMAYKYAKLRQERQAAVARRDIVRQFRMARAVSMISIGNESGGTRSSAPQGAVSSLGAQFGFNSAFFDADVYLNQQYQRHSNKAGKHAAAANMINNTASAIYQAAPAFKSFFAPTPTTTPAGGGPVSQTSLGSNNYAGGNWSTFAPPKPFST